MSIERDPFPVDALPDPVRQFVEAVAGATSTDPSFAALAALVSAAGAIGNRCAALVKRGWVEPSVLWGALVAKSGAIKSPVLKHATRPFIESYKRDRAAFAEAMREYTIALARHEAAAKECKANGGDVASLPAAPDRPIQKRTLVSDSTIEKLGALLHENPLGLLLVRDELASWVGSFDRYAGGRGSDAASWLSFYDAAPVVIDRKTTGSYFIERGAVSVLGSIQPRTLERVFGAAERESGLLARVLLVHPPDSAARWTDAELGERDADEWHNLILGLIDLPPGTDGGGAPCPRYLPLTTEARRMFVGWHDTHAAELADEGDDDLRAHLAKLKGACVRLALIFEMTALAAGRGRGTCIGPDALRRAAAVADWFKAEARRIYATLGESDEARADRLILEHVRKVGGRATVRDLQRAGPLSGRTADDVELILGALVKRGLGRWVDVPAGPAGGRPTRFFCLDEAAPAADKTPADAGKTAPADDKTPQNPEKHEVVSSVSNVGSPAPDQNGQPEPAADGGESWTF